MLDNPNANSERQNRIAAAQAMLGAPRDIDVKLGIDELFGLLYADPEDPAIYPLLVQAAREHPVHTHAIQERLMNLASQGSVAARRALDELQAVPATPLPPTYEMEDLAQLSIAELITRADDFYYAAEYDRAMQVYREVLGREPQNAHAQEQFRKAELLQGQERLSRDLPREAVQFYRRARSYLNARDIRGAAHLLESALGAAEQREMLFPQAQALLDSLNDALVAVEFKEAANTALREKNWEAAIEQLGYALTLDPNDVVAKTLTKQVEQLYDIKNSFRKLEIPSDNPIQQVQDFKAVRYALNRSRYSIILTGLRDQLEERLQEVAENIGKQLFLQAKTAFRQAEQDATMLRQKEERYDEAVKWFDEAMEINPKLTPSRRATAADRLQLIQEARRKIKALKDIQKFPQETSLEDVILWSELAPDDPDVERAKNYIRLQDPVRKAKIYAVLSAIATFIILVLAFLPVQMLRNQTVFVIFIIAAGVSALLTLVFLFFAYLRLDQ